MCNCNSTSTTSCGCPGANCNCPPDYSFDPAVLQCTGTECEATLPTACIFSSDLLSCLSLSGGTDLQTILEAIDTRLCAGTSGLTGLQLYYVDSNNTVSGDGSVTNPFKTLEQARTKIIGTGTAAAPQNTNVTVYVMGGVYNTSMNIYVPSSSWYFFPRARVNFTASGGTTKYFIDTTSIAGVKPFKIAGWMEFEVMDSGGFLLNSGTNSNTLINKSCEIEVFSLKSLYVDPSGTLTTDLISSNVGSLNTSPYPISTRIKLQNRESFILSAQQPIITFTGGILDINLNDGYIQYGLSGSTETGIDSANVGLLSNSNCSAASNLFLNSSFSLKNGFVISAMCAYMFKTEGSFHEVFFENLTTVSPGLSYTKPGYFLASNALCAKGSNPAASPADYIFLLREVYLKANCFSGVAPYEAIKYLPSGNTNLICMQECVLPYNVTVDNDVILNGDVSGVALAFYNIINGKNIISSLPTYANRATAIAAGVKSGTLFKDNSNTSNPYVISIV